MIVATRQCGCPPKKEEPPCSPCCVNKRSKKTELGAGCGSSKNLKSILSRPKIKEPICCPIKPPECKEPPVVKVRSDIAERGLPYKELEATINDNRLVIRTQKEPPKEDFDPPCDCSEDPRAKIIEEEKKPDQPSDSRTLTLFPQGLNLEDEAEKVSQEEHEEPEPPKRMLEENPNIFRLRVWKKSKDGQNIDLEFRTPRPWSKKMRLEHEKALLLAIKPKALETLKEQDEKEVEPRKKKKKRSGRSRKRKVRNECEEILARTPCGKKKRKISDDC
ncbi:uncharacterized protein LOC117228621 [Megalopta genalis]|uniref:uncharacterized protein LOC117228621 n=1 Tax=Megalopta genalis TaxID=115081 RepID=UPI003FD3D470